MDATAILRDAAKDGTLDPKEWPQVQRALLSRLHENFVNSFPKPSFPPLQSQLILNSNSTPPREEHSSSQDSQAADKENAPPAASPSRPPVPSFSRNSEGASAQAATNNASLGALYPPEIHALHNSIHETIKKNFPQNPPHTVQRLAELVLNPTAHYRFLPSYLHALDRVISVSSPTTIFPLPQASIPGHNLVNGGSPASSAASSSALGSDESLGGALLTPISWLRPERAQEDGSTNSQGQNELVSESTEMVEGPNGAGRIETVTVSNGVLTSTSAPSTSQPSTSTTTSAPPTTSGAPNVESLRDTGAITQGELLRQEQEAGVVPVSQTHSTAHSHAHPQPHNILLSSASSQSGQSGTTTDASRVDADAQSGYADAGADNEQDERPHARGPDEIGMEDMGPQQERSSAQLDIAKAVGREPTSPVQGETSPDSVSAKEDFSGTGSAKESEDKEMADADAEGEADKEKPTSGPDSTTQTKADSDIVLTDVDGNTDAKLDSMEVQGEGKGAEAADTSTRS